MGWRGEDEIWVANGWLGAEQEQEKRSSTEEGDGKRREAGSDQVGTKSTETSRLVHETSSLRKKHTRYIGSSREWVSI